MKARDSIILLVLFLCGCVSNQPQKTVQEETMVAQRDLNKERFIPPKRLISQGTFLAKEFHLSKQLKWIDISSN